MKKLGLVLCGLLFLLAALPVLADDTNNPGDGDTVVSVPKKYVSAEGLQHQVQSTPQKASEWIGIGKEIGEATKEGLNSVVDAADKFGSTKVGTFVMVMIAWKIMAKDILGVVLGVPFLIGGIIFWWQIMKKFFFGYQVLDKVDGKVKTYKRQDPYDFDSAEARAFCGTMCFVCIVGFLLGMASIIF